MQTCRNLSCTVRDTWILSLLSCFAWKISIFFASFFEKKKAKKKKKKRQKKKKKKKGKKKKQTNKQNL